MGSGLVGLHLRDVLTVSHLLSLEILPHERQSLL